MNGVENGAQVPMTVERIMNVVRLLPDMGQTQAQGRIECLQAIERMLFRFALEHAEGCTPVAIRVRDLNPQGPGRWRYLDFDPSLDLHRPNEEVQILGLMAIGDGGNDMDGG